MMRIKSVILIRQALLLALGIAGTCFGWGATCQAQQLLPDIVPWVRADDPYLVNWDISGSNLRMQTMFANIGDGLMQIRTDGAAPAPPGPATTPVTQRVFSGVDNGPNFTDYSVNTAVNFHAEHGHIHFEDFSEFQLLAANIAPSGIVTVGNLVTNTVKTSFRLRDIERIPDPAYPNNVSYPSSNTGFFQNISVGWGDVYSHGTEGQSVSLAGVPVGPWYWLRQIVDPTNVLREKNETNNSFEILIDLTQPGKAIRHLNGNFIQPGDLAPPLPGDLTGDRTINLQDWIAFKATANSSLIGLDDHAALVLGDLNLDRQHSLSDTLLFRKYFETANGAGSLAAVLNIPEPSTFWLGGAALVLLAAGRRESRRGRATKWLAVGLVVVAICPAPREAAANVTLFSENFDGLTLGPNVEETEAGTAVWTQTPPVGWSVDDSGVPGAGNPPNNNGVFEWAGWSFANKNWWATAAGGQLRETFSRGAGTVMIADPDEWDDATHPLGLYNAFVTTKTIPIPAGIPAGQIKLGFASSWRPEGNDDNATLVNDQRATIKASYNGGAPITVMTWTSLSGSPTFHPDSPNEAVIVDLQYNGTATDVKLTFGLDRAENDWWWAVDNIEVFTPTVLEVNTTTGAMAIVGAANLTGYEIKSAAGSLNHAGWEAGNFDAQGFGPATPLSADFNNSNVVDAADYVVWRDALGADNRGDANGDGVTNPLDYAEFGKQFGQSLAEGESWETLISTDAHLMEFYLLGSSTFTTRAIGLGYKTALDARDLSFKYTSVDGQEFAGTVRYVTSGAASFASVPEPATWGLLVMGWLAVIPSRRAKIAALTATRESAAP